MHKYLLTALFLLFPAALLPAQTETPKPSPNTAFDTRTASRLLQQLNVALQGHSQKKLLDLFDLSKMKDSELFKQQITSFFAQTESIQCHLNLAETSADNDQATLAVDSEVEIAPRNGGLPWRRQDRLRFSLINVNGQWKFIDIQPRSFFSLAP